MPFADLKRRKQYLAGYWKQYYSDPDKRRKHIAAVRRNGVKRKAAIKAWVAARKVELGCRVCGFKEHHAALDFAHRDRESKSVDIGLAVSKWSLKKIMAEVEKCDVVCANHHRIETFLENEVIHAPARAMRTERLDRILAEQVNRPLGRCCKHGHEYSVSNTHRDKKGSRVCRECDKLKRRRYRSNGAVARVAGRSVVCGEGAGSSPVSTAS